MSDGLEVSWSRIGGAQIEADKRGGKEISHVGKVRECGGGGASERSADGTEKREEKKSPEKDGNRKHQH